MILDTNLLIRLERELRRGERGVATAFFEGLEETRLCITPTIAGEFACGRTMGRREIWEEALAPYEILPVTREVGWHYGELYRMLAERGILIGTNDLWIAATAVVYEMPLATGNLGEFGRVDGLEVVGVVKG
ncbi:MAG: type II toxin-antitoxin system VapC family toxin [Verrucomicrobiota bacterium]